MNPPETRQQAAQRAEDAQNALVRHYWNDEASLFERTSPKPGPDDTAPLHYWWLAHALDALVDRFERTGDAGTRDRLTRLLPGLVRANAGQLTNDYYDDMEWLALACLRAYDATGEQVFASAALDLWSDIQGGWNEHCGGGIAWRKFQLDYKNTPANAPAAILAARLHGRLGIADGLDWAERIYRWNREHLVNPQTGFVWDGMNREGDGRVDQTWRYTYCQGVMIGAGVELHRLTGNGDYLRDAKRTARTALAELSDPRSGTLQYEDQGDGGLFKGILVRYLGRLLQAQPDEEIQAALVRNAESLWSVARTPEGLCGPDWAGAVPSPLDLSSHLSGVMLFETLARLDGED
ncbi:MAG TPA: glycoside hydrolase family 76 protein [Deinococcales bacterium]|nr:glycoside hydrolase family 76 protein [Deinococcales bacterium]